VKKNLETQGDSSTWLETLPEKSKEDVTDDGSYHSNAKIGGRENILIAQARPLFMSAPDRSNAAINKLE